MQRGSSWKRGRGTIFTYLHIIPVLRTICCEVCVLCCWKGRKCVQWTSKGRSSAARNALPFPVYKDFDDHGYHNYISGDDSIHSHTTHFSDHQTRLLSLSIQYLYFLLHSGWPVTYENGISTRSMCYSKLKCFVTDRYVSFNIYFPIILVTLKWS